MIDTTGAAPGAGPQTHFGYSHVPLADKQRQVDAVFHDVASRYDLMNDLMSAGLHRLWKEDFVARIRPQRARPFHHLDVAGGTGDIAFRVARNATRMGTRATDITVLDINAAMLREGRRRAAQGGIGGLRFVQANAEALPFPDGSFDAYTIAFGIRNVPQIDVALAEAHRVLRRGGRFLCLEFSDVDIPWLDRLYETYSFRVIPAVGKLVTGHAEAYQYLVESIRRFPEADAFRGMILRAGFARVTFTRMSGGIVAIHSGWKL